MTFADFVSHELLAPGLPQDSEKPFELVKETLQAKIVRGTPLIKIRADGYTPEDAKKIIVSVLEMIQKEHAELLAPAPAVAHQQKTLAAPDDLLAAVHMECPRTLDAIRSTNVSLGRDFSVLLANLMKSDRAYVGTLQDQRFALVEQQDPTCTFNTKAETPIYVSPIPGSISKTVGPILCGMSGFAIRFAFCFA